MLDDDRSVARTYDDDADRGGGDDDDNLLMADQESMNIYK